MSPSWSDQPPSHPTQAADLWWLAKGSEATGPYERAELQQALRVGAVLSQDLACPESGAQWRALHDWPVFAGCFSHPAADSRPSAAPLERAFWRPPTIALLGILFSPFWAATMAAMNARRLGGSLSAWRPILVAFGGYLLATLLGSCFSPNRFWGPWLLDVGLYLLTLWVIWQWDLRRQAVAYCARAGEAEARWLWPVIAGLPLGAVVLLALVAAPFAPLGPRDVAQRFLSTNDVPTVERYCTPRLFPAMEALLAGDDGSAPLQYTLTFDRDDSPGSHTHWVGFVAYAPDASGQHSIDGAMRLIDFDGPWKVDEVYFNAYDSKPLPQAAALSADYPKIIAGARQTEAAPRPALASAAPAAPAPAPVPAASASPPTVASVVEGVASQQQTQTFLAHASASSLAGTLSSGADAAERQAASAFAREAEQGAGHEGGSLLARGGKMVAAAFVGAILLLFNLIKSVFEGSKPAGDGQNSQVRPRTST